MLQIAEDPRRKDVWLAMADHFLDTETRQDIPLTSMRCVAAGLSTAEARDVWCFEVSPAVAFNAWDIAGEWAAWDSDWLVTRIEQARKSWSNRPGPVQWCLYRTRVHVMHGVWLSIERCTESILERQLFEEQQQMSRDLRFLARHYFDFCGEDPKNLEPAAWQRAQALYPEPLRYIMAPSLVRGEAVLADRRVRAVLESEPKP